MQMVERGHQLQGFGHQQTVAEHIASHVADTDDADHVGLHVDAALTEVPLHRNPGAARGNAHLLVVVACRAARGKGVAEPEVVFGGDAVGDVRKARGALVRSDHQIGIVTVIAQYIGGRNDLAFMQVIGDVEQATDENAIAGDRFGLNIIPRATGRQTTRHETAFRAAGNDYRILHLLRLDQAEHFGAVVLFTVGPAQPSTRHLAAAQVHALDPWRIDEYLVHRCRARHLRDRARIELEAEIRLGFAVGIRLIEVGSQGGLNQRKIAPQNPVLVEYRHLIKRCENRLFQPLLLVCQILVTELARQVEAHLEQPHQLAGDIRVVEQRAGDIAKVEAHANLLEIARIGAQQRHFPPGQPGGQHQTVESIILGKAAVDMDERILQRLVDLQQVDFQTFGIGEGEVVYPVLAAAAVTQPERKLAEHPQPQVLHDRQDVRQRQRCIQVVELAVQAVLFSRDRLIEAHHQRAFLAEVEHMLHVDGGRLRREALAVAGRETFRKLAEQMGAPGLAEALDHQALVVVLPGAAGLQHFLLQTHRIHLQRAAGV